MFYDYFEISDVCLLLGVEREWILATLVTACYCAQQTNKEPTLKAIKFEITQPAGGPWQARIEENLSLTIPC